MKAIVILGTISLLGLLAMLSVACQPQAAPTALEDGLIPALSPSAPPTSTELPIEESPFRDMACKKVIIRGEDVGGEIDASLRWLSELIVSKDVKATYAVIPAWLLGQPETVNYLNNLDKNHFEMGTLGYTHEVALEGLPYEEQFALIEKATNLMEEYFHVRPYTFLPPWDSADLNTLRVCEALGYHTLASSRLYPESAVATDFAVSDFAWGSGWELVSHGSYAEFEQAFDDSYSHDESMPSNEPFVISLHHTTFYDESGQPKSELVSDFERSIDYMKSKNVEFMTIEEAYQWYVDEPHIVVGKENGSTYFIDLMSCQYDHTVSFQSPPDWDHNAIIKNLSTGERTPIYRNFFRFYGLKGHSYEIIYHAEEFVELPSGGSYLSGLTNRYGALAENTIVRSFDDMCALIIARGTRVETELKAPDLYLNMVEIRSTPTLPEDEVSVGLVYKFVPTGAILSPPATLEFTYVPTNVPPGIPERDLVLASWDAEARKWVGLDYLVDPATHTITAEVGGSATFAILAPRSQLAAFRCDSLVISPVKVNNSESTKVSVSVTNIGGAAGSYEVVLKVNRVVEASKEVTLDAGATSKVSFEVTKAIDETLVLYKTYVIEVNGLTGSFAVKRK